MYFIVFFSVLIFVSLMYIIYLFVKKLPMMRVAIPESSGETRDKKKKNELIKMRVERSVNSRLFNLNKKVFLPAGQVMRDGFRRLAGKLTAVERRFQEKQKRARYAIDPNVLTESLVEAKEFFKKEEYDRAEKKLIEIIGIDNKFTDAYELLGQVYLEQKEFALAEETFRFLVKFASEDASAIAYLGEVLEEIGKKEEALECYEKAVSLSPKNPKYLDFLISLALDLEQKDKAREFLKKLKEVNEDNRKIEEFEGRLDLL